MSNVASKLIDSASEGDKARLDTFIVDEVKVTTIMPNGAKSTKSVGYGATLTAPEVDLNLDRWYDVSWVDQYGNEWDYGYDTVTYPVTLTAKLTPKKDTVQVASKVLGDCYNATAPERAWVNGSTPEVLKSGVPAGFNVLNKFTWYKDSTSIWKGIGK